MYSPPYENLKRQALDTAPPAPSHVRRGGGLNTAAARSRGSSKTVGSFANGR